MDRNNVSAQRNGEQGDASPYSRSSSQNSAYEPITAAPSSATKDNLQVPTIPRPNFSASQSSIRLRRVSSTQPPTQAPTQQIGSSPLRQSVPPPKDDIQVGGGVDRRDTAASGRRRSSSEPQRILLNYTDTPGTRGRGTSVAVPSQMANVLEEATSPVPIVDQNGKVLVAMPPQKRSMLRRAAGSVMNLRRTNTSSTVATADLPDEYRSNFVDVLDVIDPEVSTLSTLTNVQNSLFVPDLGRFLNRRPTYDLSSSGQPAVPSTIPEGKAAGKIAGKTTGAASKPPPKPSGPDTHELQEIDLQGGEGLRPVTSHTTIKSTLSTSRYAVLPHGAVLEGWTDADKDELNDHVRHMLHSKRSKFKRRMKGFGQYVSKPLGFFVTLYATLITLFGLAWVLFLIGWVNVGGKQSYDINVIDNVLVALFAIMGDGLAPFRAVDTYHMCFIAHYHHLTWRLRKEAALPKLQDHNDLPPLPGVDEERLNDEETDLERGEKQEHSVLNANQQKKLKHHQDKFSKSHTFYRPHETTTHHAFPLRLLVAVVVLLDCHSLFQIALGTCTWSISYHVRPFALTTVILCCSITCNITAGILILIGDRLTRKKEVVERMFRQELTEEAIEKVKKRQEKERKRLEEREQEIQEERRQLEEREQKAKEEEEAADRVKHEALAKEQEARERGEAAEINLQTHVDRL